jgi:hypothetical protein
MNERIKELAIEAGYMEDNFGIGHWDMPECKNFAELIIRECMHVAVYKSDGMIFTADIAGHRAAGREIAAKMIKQHFGVE